MEFMIVSKPSHKLQMQCTLYLRSTTQSMLISKGVTYVVTKSNDNSAYRIEKSKIEVIYPLSALSSSVLLEELRRAADELDRLGMYHFSKYLFCLSLSIAKTIRYYRTLGVRFDRDR